MEGDPGIAARPADAQGFAHDPTRDALAAEFGEGVHRNEVRHTELRDFRSRLLCPEPDAPARHDPMVRYFCEEDDYFARFETRSEPTRVHRGVGRKLAWGSTADLGEHPTTVVSQNFPIGNGGLPKFPRPGDYRAPRTSRRASTARHRRQEAW